MSTKPQQPLPQQVNVDISQKTMSSVISVDMM